MTLKQIARDWSVDGEEERKQCYQPIIDEIEAFYKSDDMYVAGAPKLHSFAINWRHVFLLKIYRTKF